MNKFTYLTPEEGPLPEKVRRAMSRDIWGLTEWEIKEACTRVEAGLKVLLGTKEPVTVSFAGMGEVQRRTLQALFEPGEEVLVVEAGVQGLQLSHAAQACGLEILALPIPWGRAVKVGEVENTLARWPKIKAVLLPAVEISTGALHPVQEIAGLCRSFEKMLVLDATGFIGSHASMIDAWSADCVLSASGPDIMAPPGAVFTAFSHRVREKMHKVFQADKSLWLDPGKIRLEEVSSHPLLHLLPALDEAVGMFMHQGLDQASQYPNALCLMARAGVEAIGLELLVQRDFARSLTSIKLPPGIDEKRLLQIARDDYCVVMSGGQGQLEGRTVRMGHAGCTSWKDVLAGLVALREAFLDCGGVSGSRDYLERAWMAYAHASDRKHL
ncbi:aminotransferase class V-fold PLP-dependent enzyme [Desulfonatronospira sp.]|uniref:aminotransferase class V-fold PLP-dependent enzyme n=1 Tax=Desulfonatronospira sp. TaxID=1962951 RepID=UPI0025BAFA65|nr:aminotransferase class V-fold PLP-dependent enzyme [Desulfonatronospira sp.]